MTDGHGQMQFEYTCRTVQGMTGRTYVAITVRKGSFIRVTHIPLGPELTQIYFRRLGFIQVQDIDGRAVNLREIEPYATYHKFERDEEGVLIGVPGTVITHSPPLYLACYPAKPATGERRVRREENNSWESTKSNTIQVEISGDTPAATPYPYQVGEPYPRRRKRRRYMDREERHRHRRPRSRERRETERRDSCIRETHRESAEKERERRQRRSAYLKARVESDRVEGVYVCNLCATTSSTFSALVNHMFTEHSIHD